jgi:hypothetical protein
MVRPLTGAAASPTAGGEDPTAGLLRLAYVILSPSLGRRRRARIAEKAVRRSLGDGPGAVGPAEVRVRLVKRVLFAGRGLVTIPRPTGRGPAGETDRRLAALVPAARAAWALRRLEGLDAEETADLLRAVGVRDPETVVALAERTPLDEHVVRSVEIPLRGATRRNRLVLSGVVAAVLAIAAPVLAAQADGGAHPDPAGRIAPASSSTDVQAPPAGPAAGPATDGAKVRRDLDRILKRLTAALKEPGTAGPEADRLRSLMAAVREEQQRVAGR